MSLTKEIIVAYRKGYDLEYISKQQGIALNDVENYLASFKESSKYKNSFTSEFKEAIAKRDASGVSRKQISREMGITEETVKKYCIKYGEVHKVKVVLREDEYTSFPREFDMSTCPSCDSRNVNNVGGGRGKPSRNTYCMDCGDEYIHQKNSVLKVNWEYFE